MRKGLGDVMFRPAGASEWQKYSAVKALVIKQSNGNVLSIGKPEDRFELELTEEDKDFLHDI